MEAFRELKTPMFGQNVRKGFKILNYLQICPRMHATCATCVHVPTCRLASSSLYELETLLYISIRTLWGLNMSLCWWTGSDRPVVQTVPTQEITNFHVNRFLLRRIWITQKGPVFIRGGKVFRFRTNTTLYKYSGKSKSTTSRQYDEENALKVFGVLNAVK